MKNGIFSVCFAAALLSIGISATAADVKVKNGTGTVTVTGQTEPDSMIGLQVLEKDKEWDDFEKSGYSEKMIKYNDQTAADAEGMFSFDFVLDGESGKYKVYIAYSKQDGEEVDVNFINAEEMKSFLQSLNALAKSGDKDGFYTQLCQNDWLSDNTTDALRQSINYRSMSDLLCQYTANNPLSIDTEPIATVVFNTFVAIEAEHEGKLHGVISCLDSLYHNDKLEYWIDFISEKKNAVDYMESVLNNRKPGDPEEFDRALTEAVILSVVRYSVGYENTKKVMQEFDDYLEIGKKDDSVYKTLAGNSYSSVAALKEAAGTKVNTGGITGGGAGGGKGSGSGKMPAGTYTGNNADNKKPSRISLPFIDIDDVSWANEAITALYDKGLIRGKTDTRFYPNDFITREEFVKMTVIAKNIAPSIRESAFSDVSLDAWYNGYVNAGVEANLIQGIDDGKFGSGMNISRQDIATILYRMTQLPYSGNTASFEDMDAVADYAVNAVSALKENEIVSGTDEGKFEPESNATRAEAAKMLYGVLKYLN